MASKSIGDRVRVIDQDWIIGTIVEDWGKNVVITDDHSELADNTLFYKKSELQLIEKRGDDGLD